MRLSFLLLIVLPCATLGNSFSISWVLAPDFGTIYSWETSWQVGPLFFGIEASVFGEAWLAQSPTLGIPLLYGVVSDLRLRYAIGFQWQSFVVEWQHICYYKLNKDRWWDGQGLELVRFHWRP